jgi:predicted amidohydrolase YtcJ
MRAITIDAARSLNLEKRIGSLEAGKVANFTLLASNPLTIDPMLLKDISIEGIVYKGKLSLNKD